MSPENPAPHTEQHPNPKISEEEFGRQFEEQKSITIDGQVIFYHAVEPADPVSERWVVYIGALGTHVSMYEREIQDLVSAGRKVVYMNPDQYVEVTDEASLSSLGIPTHIHQKARTIIDALKQLEIDSADIIGHSQGAVVASTIAYLEPDFPQHLILDSPAGTYADDSHRSLKRRFLADKKNESTDQRAVNKENLLQRPDKITQVDQETRALAEMKLLPLLKALESRYAREVALITANNDQVFPPHKVDEQLDPAVINNLKRVMYADKEATHQYYGATKSTLLEQLLAEENEGTT